MDLWEHSSSPDPVKVGHNLSSPLGVPGLSEGAAMSRGSGLAAEMDRSGLPEAREMRRLPYRIIRKR